MDYRDPKNQVLAIIVIGFLALFYLWYTNFYTPNASTLNAKTTEHDRLRSELFAVRQEAKTLSSLQDEYAELSARYERVKLWLPEYREEEAFLAQLHIAAQLTNSTILSLLPETATPHDFYTANSYKLETESSYHNLGNFLAKVVNFPFIVTISDIQMKARPELSTTTGKEQRRKDNTVIASFKLTTYHTHQGGQTQ